MIKNENILVVNYKPHGVARNKVKPELWLYRSPRFIVRNNTDYRIIPMYKDIGVSKVGGLISLTDNSTIKSFIYGGYLTVSTKDYLNNNIAVTRIHRLVALAWVTNTDFIKHNIVDHIDGDKFNNTAANLRWVSNSVNVSSFSHGRLGRFTIANMVTGIRVSMNSLTSVARYFDMDNRNFKISRLPQIINYHNIDYLIIDGCSGKDAVTEYLNKKYAFKVVKMHDVTKIRYFKTKHDLYDAYCIVGRYKTIAIARTQLKALGYNLIDIKDVSIANKYNIKNLSTGKECKNLTLKEVINITNAPRGTVLSRLNKDYRYGKPMGDWVLKSSADTNDYLSSTVSVNKTYRVTKDNETKTFSSLRKIAEYLNCDRKTIKKAIEQQQLLQGYRVLVS